MNYNQALDYIHSLLVFGSRPGLERISVLLEKLGNPQEKLKFIHVAGTNGKGSTCAMLAEIYRRAGYRTGLYTSPFVVDFRERIRLDGEYIEKDMLAQLCGQVKATGITVTEFEFITALAMLYFAAKKCDIVILETGLGGRFDATNVIKAPLASVITRIDFDHMAYLGNTLAEIAAEKCGIIKPGCPTVSYPFQEKEAAEVIRQHADRLIVPDAARLKILSSDLTGNRFVYQGDAFTVSLIGEHQVSNALTAIETVRTAGLAVPETALRSALASVCFPARLEIISKAPPVLLDGAHNPNGAEALAAVMKRFDRNIVAIVGMMADKNCDDFLRITLPYCRSLITVRVKENPRSITAEKLAALAKKYCGDVSTADAYDEAIRTAASKAGGKAPIFVFGSLYLAGAIRDKLISFFH